MRGGGELLRYYFTVENQTPFAFPLSSLSFPILFLFHFLLIYISIVSIWTISPAVLYAHLLNDIRYSVITTIFIFIVFFRSPPRVINQKNYDIVYHWLRHNSNKYMVESKVHEILNKRYFIYNIMNLIQQNK